MDKTIIKTAIDTLGTTGILEQFPNALQQAPDIGGDFKAPLIAVMSSVLIQLSFIAVKWLGKKIEGYLRIPQ